MEPSSHVLTATTVGNVISPKRDFAQTWPIPVGAKWWEDTGGQRPWGCLTTACGWDMLWLDKLHLRGGCACYEWVILKTLCQIVQWTVSQQHAQRLPHWEFKETLARCFIHCSAQRRHRRMQSVGTTDYHWEVPIPFISNNAVITVALWIPVRIIHRSKRCRNASLKESLNFSRHKAFSVVTAQQRESLT